MRMVKPSALTIFISILLCACSYQDAPPCRFSGQPAIAPSAGCFSVIDQRLLVVQNLAGDISPPGGSSNRGETAQCTAVRETWEETGLTLKVGPKLATFTTGFHLYQCQRDADSGEIGPPQRLEIRQAFYLHVNEFDQWEWRYPEQEDFLRKLVESPGVSY
jgi:8-oxo-dGTP diphosphatase